MGLLFYFLHLPLRLFDSKTGAVTMTRSYMDTERSVKWSAPHRYISSSSSSPPPTTTTTKQQQNPLHILTFILVCANFCIGKFRWGEALPDIIIILMYIYHALINALSALNALSMLIHNHSDHIRQLDNQIRTDNRL